MKRTWMGIAALVLSCYVAGCDSGETKLPAEQQSPDYGAKTGAQMKNEIGIPGKGGAMQKPAAK